MLPLKSPFVHASSDAPVCCCLTNRLRLAGWCPSTVCRLVHQVGCELAAPHNFCSASLVGQAADESHGRTAYELRWHRRQAWMHLNGGRDQHEPDAWLMDGEVSPIRWMLAQYTGPAHHTSRTGQMQPGCCMPLAYNRPDEPCVTNVHGIEARPGCI